MPQITEQTLRELRRDAKRWGAAATREQALKALLRESGARAVAEGKSQTEAASIAGVSRLTVAAWGKDQGASPRLQGYTCDLGRQVAGFLGWYLAGWRPRQVHRTPSRPRALDRAATRAAGDPATYAQEPQPNSDHSHNLDVAEVPSRPAAVPRQTRTCR